MSQFRIVSFPPSPATDSQDALDCWLIRLETADGKRYALALRGLEEDVDPSSLSGTFASAIATDLLRPGWDSLAHIKSTPVMLEDRVYHAFVLRRRCRLDGGRAWELECYIETPIDEVEDWDGAIRTLNDLHQAVTRSPNSNV